MTNVSLMTCREINDFLIDYLSGELAWQLRERFEEHIAICPACLSYLAQYRDTIRLGRAALQEPDAELPPELLQAILATHRLK